MRERLNHRLLAWMIGALALLAAGVFFLHRFQVRRNAPGLRALARTAESAGRPDRAARLLRLYLTYRPEDADARADYGALLETFGETSGVRAAALDAYEEVLLRDPDRPEVRKRLARLHVAEGHYDEALEVLKPFGPESDDPVVVLLTGACHEGRLEYARAAKEYNRAIRLAPKSIPAHLRLADLLRLHFNDTAAAGRAVDGMVAANGNDYRAYLARARYRLALKEGGAEEDLRRARELAAVPVSGARTLLLAGLPQGPLLATSALFPGRTELAPDGTDADLLLESARAAWLGRHLPEARRYLCAALANHPADGRVCRALALLEAEAGERARAVQYLRQGVARLPGDAGLLLPLADLLLKQGDLPGARKAVAELKRWKAPAHRTALLQARLDAGEGKWNEARQALETNRPLLAADSPDLLVQADLLLGLCQEKLGNAEQELAAYRRAAREAPRNPAAQAALMQALVRRGKDEEAAREARRQPAGPAGVLTLARCYEAAGRVERAEAEYRSAVQAAPEDVNALQNLTAFYRRTGTPAKAIQTLEDLGREQKLSPAQEVYLAQLHWEAGNWAESRRLALDALSRDGDNPARVRFYVDRLLDRGEYAEAEVWLGRLERLAPDDPATLARRARARARTGRGGEAVSLLTRYAEAGKADPEVRADRRRAVAGLLAQFARESPQSGKDLNLSAEKMYRKAAESGRVKDSLALAEYLACRGQYPRAEAEYRRLLKRDPRNVEVMNNLALMLLLQGREPKEALALLERAVSLAGPSAGLLDTRGLVYLRAGQVDRAAEDFRKAVAAGPNPVRFLHLAQAHHRAGRREEARQWLEKATTAEVERRLVLPDERRAYQQLRQELLKKG